MTRVADYVIAVTTVVAVITAAVIVCAIARWVWLALAEVAREIVFQLRMRGVIR